MTRSPDRDRADVDQQPPIIEIQRVGGRDRRLPLFVALLVALLAIPVLKPWEWNAADSAPPASAAQTVPVRVAVPSPVVLPTPTPTPIVTLSPQQLAALAALDRRQCQSNVGWRVVTIEQTGPRHTRTLLAVTPKPLRSDAADPRIPAVVLYAERLLGVGYCVPSPNGAAPDRPKPEVAIWRIPERGAPVRIENLTRLDEGLMAAGEYYYGPPGNLTLDPWAPGRYVFEILPENKRSPSQWFALDFRYTATAASGASSPAP